MKITRNNFKNNNRNNKEFIKNNNKNLNIFLHKIKLTLSKEIHQQTVQCFVVFQLVIVLPS